MLIILGKQRHGHANSHMADVHFIDGQALAPTDFGQFDSSGVWQAKAFSGTYGTNGFHLDFSDNSSNAALGYDAAGSNDWTVNNLTAGLTAYENGAWESNYITTQTGGAASASYPPSLGFDGDINTNTFSFHLTTVLH